MDCHGRTTLPTMVQEIYETASRDAGRRTRQARAAGHRATAGALGPQVTPVGTVRMTIVNIEHKDGEPIPAPENLIRL